MIGLEYEGCYFIDVESGEVRYLDHGVGLRYQEAGGDFVEFLEQVIEAQEIERRRLAADIHDLLGFIRCFIHGC